jgi:hypothetical protein
MRTAVARLQAKLWENNMLTNDDLKLFKEALEIEKEQIEMAYKADLHPCSDEDAEEYYNQTFKQK